HRGERGRGGVGAGRRAHVHADAHLGHARDLNIMEGAAGGEDQLDIERSGGFGGLTLHASVPLSTLEPRERAAIEQLLGRPPSSPSGPDRFVYRFRMHGREAVVQEDKVPAELQRLLERLTDSWS